MNAASVPQTYRTNPTDQTYFKYTHTNILINSLWSLPNRIEASIVEKVDKLFVHNEKLNQTKLIYSIECYVCVHTNEIGFSQVLRSFEEEEKKTNVTKELYRLDNSIYTACIESQNQRNTFNFYFFTHKTHIFRIPLAWSLTESSCSAKVERSAKKYKNKTLCTRRFFLLPANFISTQVN